VAAARKSTRQTKTVAQAVTAVAGVTPKSALEKLNTAKLAINEKLADVDTAMLAQIQEMQNLDTVISERKAELKDLYEIEVGAETLATLKAEQEAWLVERDAARERRITTDNDEIVARNKAWNREDEEHAYAVEQRNARDAAAALAETQERQRLEKIRMEEVARNLVSRVEEIEKREEALTAKQAEIDAMPATIEAAANTAVIEATGKLLQAHRYEKMVAEKDAENQIGLLRSEIGALKTALSASEGRNALLVKQADSAAENAKAIALQAVQAAAGKQALEAVQADRAAAAPATTGRRG
jgi:hypothetical protein